jgi:MSHA pilin protein MshA
MLNMRRGFTLIELIMVIVILGILAVVAIPRFVDLKDEAEEAAEQGVKAAIESGAQLWKAKYLVGDTDYTVEYPPSWGEALDSDTTSDIDDKFTITYTSTTGKATANSK